jgi:hypothetical protein
MFNPLVNHLTFLKRYLIFFEGIITFINNQYTCFFLPDIKHQFNSLN